MNSKNGRFHLQFIQNSYSVEFMNARNHFLKSLKDIRCLTKLIDDHDWISNILLAEAIHFATDAVNRVVQDPTGSQTLCYYLISIMLLHDFLCEQRLLPVNDHHNAVDTLFF